MDRIQQLEQVLVSLISELRESQKLSEWLHITDNIEEAANKEFNDTAWRKVILGWHIQWQASDTIALFRRKISIPEQICGINLAGARLEGMFFTPLAGEVFIDGVKIAESDWLPDIIFPIKEKISGGEEFQITVKTKPGSGWGVVFWSRIYIDKVDDAIFQLELFLNLLRLTQSIISWKPSLKTRYEKLLNTVLEIVDMKSLGQKRIDMAMSSIYSAQEVLVPIAKETKKFVIHLIGHAHIDMNWLWSWQATLNTAKNTFTTVMDKLMAKYPKFCFSQSQAGLYEAIEKKFPELFEKIRKRVAEKKWDITASTWVEGDLNTASGETLIRHILYAKKYIKQKFGLEPRIAWCPDTFGHVWTYPQILKKSGIEFYFGHRCRPKNEYPLFWWESPDGSRVLAVVHGESYNYQVRPELCMGFIYTKNRTGSNHYLVSCGVGDHGGGPTLRDLARVERLQQIKQFPQIKFDFAENYYKAVLKEKKQLPVVKDELNFTFEGCYTTHSDIKMMNRISENIVQSAEVISTMMYCLYRGEYQQAKLYKSWQNTCFNQFHDILCGTAIHSSYGDGEQHAKTLFTEILNHTRETIDLCLKGLSKKITYNSDGIPVIVVNTLSWGRTDVVIIDQSANKNIKLQEMAVYDEKGNPVANQFNGSQLIFTAEVPPVGYRVYYLRQGNRKDELQIPVIEDKNSYKVDPDLFSVSIDKTSGCLTSLFDKRTGKEMMFSFGDVIYYAKPYPEPGNLLQVYYEKPHGASAWIIGQISKIENILSGAKTALVEKGPVRVVIRVEHKILKSSLNQDIVIYKSIPRIDFYTTVDWQEKGTQDTDAPMLKVSFPVSITQDKACFEIPFGYIYRPTNGQEVPQLNWMDLSNNEYGMSILNNGKYGCSVSGNTMKLTLIRSAYDPDPVSDIGLHRFAYALYPHRNDWRKAGTVCRGYEFNQPLLVYLVSEQERTPGKASSQLLPGKQRKDIIYCTANELPEQYSLFTITPSNLIVTAFKKSEDGKSLILRFYESCGIKTRAEINLNIPVRKAVETDLMERNLTNKKLKIVNHKLKLNIGKNEIKTLKLQNTT